MKKLQKILTVGLALLFTFCLRISLSGCSSPYCDPKGKDWYNSISLPNISNPFNEIYDGSYSIKIDKDGNVLFKPLDGEEIKGKLSSSTNNEVNSWTEISIEFENGKTAEGRCDKTDTKRHLVIFYESNGYAFTDTRKMSKEEFETYRSLLIQFLTNAYETGAFPSQEEIESNKLYKEFTNYFQIDPCCGGPIVYDTVKKVIIENLETTQYGKKFSLNVNGERTYCEMEEDIVVASIKNGTIKELTLNDVKEGECLIVQENRQNYSIKGIFYIEND